MAKDAKRTGTRDLIIIFGGGTMNGIFGAGVAYAFQKANIYNRIHSVYGVSAGAHTAAYFLARDAAHSAHIYTDHLSNNTFIKTHRSFHFLVQLIRRIFDKNTSVEPLLDVDYLMKIETTTKKLDVKRIENSPIPFFVKLYDTATHKVSYVDAKTDVLEKLRAAVVLVPFYLTPAQVKGVSYIDGGIITNAPDGLTDAIAKRERGKKMVIVFNTPQKFVLDPLNILGDVIWTFLLYLVLRNPVLFNRLRVFSRYRALKKFLARENVHFVGSDFVVYATCTDKTTLLNLYNHGVQKGKEFVRTCLRGCVRTPPVL